MDIVYNKALLEILDGTIDLTGDTLVLMLVNSDYTPDKDDEVVDEGGAGDAEGAEITATNYTRAWGGAGRKAATITAERQTASDRVVFKITNVTWTSLGGAANDTVVGAILIKEGGSDDTDSRLIAYFDLADTLTNGNDFTLQFDATNGNIRFTA